MYVCVYVLYKSFIYIFRVKAYIAYGWADNIVDPDGNAAKTSAQTTCNLQVPDAWKDLKNVFKQSSQVPHFTNANVITYFVARTAADGLEARDFKSMNSSAMHLFQCGHVQQIQVAFSQERLFLSANCLPEMKKDRVYKVIISLCKSTWDILSAACGCPGGCGPVASCKHIAALCYAFCSFCEHGVLPDFLTCTDKLNEWNRPRSKKVNPILVSDLQAHQLVKKGEFITIKRAPRVPSNYDPRPISMRETSSTAVDNLRADLLSLPQPCAFVTILVPQVERSLHDHTYSKPAADATEDFEQQYIHIKESCPFSPDGIQVKCEEMVKQLNMSPNSKNQVEFYTRKQSDCALWYQVRFPRITGSKCGRILTQKSKTKALLVDILYSKPMDPVPLPIKWGRDNEPLHDPSTLIS